LHGDRRPRALEAEAPRRLTPPWRAHRVTPTPGALAHFSSVLYRDRLWRAPLSRTRSPDTGISISGSERVPEAPAGARDYLLWEGDRLCDGDVLEVRLEEVVQCRFLGSSSPQEMTRSADDERQPSP
jgi:hypothetical protein